MRVRPACNICSRMCSCTVCCIVRPIGLCFPRKRGPQQRNDGLCYPWGMEQGIAGRGTAIAHCPASSVQQTSWRFSFGHRLTVDRDSIGLAVGRESIWRGRRVFMTSELITFAWVLGLGWRAVVVSSVGLAIAQRAVRVERSRANTWSPRHVICAGSLRPR